MSGQRPWQVLLFGGASGVGKTSVSYRLAHRYGVGLTEIDDFQAILERMTAPDQYPELHFFRARPDAWRRMDEGERLAHGIRYAEALAGALELVIANHLDGAPIVLEGDFLLPTLAVRPAYDGVPAAGRVRGLFLYEDEEQIGRNYLAREGRPQPGRARASWRYSEWLRGEAERLGVPTIAARPWETVLERACATLPPPPSPTPNDTPAVPSA
jgi:2-phosphoglycerate kinase